MDSLLIYGLNKSLNLKSNFLRMTVVLHKHKIAHWKHVLFRYICCRKALCQLQNHFMSSSFSQKLDIQMILQLCGCLSATNICKHHTFSTFMQHNNHKRQDTCMSLNLKTCKSINL